MRQADRDRTASQAHTLDSFKIESAIALGLMTIVSFGLSWWMAGRALAPVHRITDAARSLSERTLHARINLQGPNDELKQLADTFDAMLGRLDRAFQQPTPVRGQRFARAPNPARHRAGAHRRGTGEPIGQPR